MSDGDNSLECGHEFMVPVEFSEELKCSYKVSDKLAVSEIIDTHWS